MPRLPPALIRNAARVNGYLPSLLRECRTIESAQNELRWMKQAILEKQLGIDEQGWTNKHVSLWRAPSLYERTLKSFVHRRAKGEPLQYILGTQPFGELEVKCRPEVLIPRPETETYTLQVARVLNDELATLVGVERHDHLPCSILDFCSGSGCISLLLHSLLKPVTRAAPGLNLQIRGFDISQHALDLAKENIQYNVKLKTLHEDAATDIQIEHLDVMMLAQRPGDEITSYVTSRFKNDMEHRSVDVMISNPPYISPEHYKPGGPTTKSVRKFEPKLALVPSSPTLFRGVDQADQFYVALLRIAAATKPKLLVMEVGDTAQAIRVRNLCRDMKVHAGLENTNISTEIWKDDGTIIPGQQDPYNSGCKRLPPRPLRDEDEPSLLGVNRDEDGVESRAVVVRFGPTIRLSSKRHGKRDVSDQ